MTAQGQSARLAEGMAQFCRGLLGRGTFVGSVARSLIYLTMRTIGSWKNKLFKRCEIKQIVEYDGEDINIIGRKLKIRDFFSKNTNKYLTTRGV